MAAQTDRRLTFAEWMARVDEYVWDMADCSADDLDDYLYADAYDDGMSPLQAAQKAIRNTMG